jgi:hypothetical protein
MHDVGRWLGFGIGFGLQGRGVAVVRCVVGMVFHVVPPIIYGCR